MDLTPVAPNDAATKTYQYLRVGMVGIVGLLAVSVAIEHLHADCFQHSISAYYFTPVRTIFVGGLMAIGAALIFISGRTLAEDILLSIAGMFAPVVAIIPTSDVGQCWSSDPPAQPVIDGKLAPWVVAGVRNNIPALLVMGVIGLVALALIPIVTKGQSPWTAFRASATSTKAALSTIALVLVIGWWAYNYWDGFFDHAHGYAATAMFVLLALAVASNAWDQRDHRDAWFWAYVGIAVAMPLAGLVTLLAGRDWDYTLLVLEVVEISLFVLFWALQTVRYWDETVGRPPDPNLDLR
jgi:hypothetical protein